MTQRKKEAVPRGALSAKEVRERSGQLLAQNARAGVDEVSPMSRMERSTDALARKLGQEEMDRQLKALPPETREPEPCPKCGRLVPVRALAVPRTFHSMWGTHTLLRNYHHCENCKRGFCPRDIKLGLPETGALTADLETRALDFALNDSFGKCADRWALHYPHQEMSINQFRQSTDRLGAALEESNPVLLQEAAKPQEPESTSTLYVMNDGSHVPCIGEWKEAKLGVFFRGEEHVSGREVTRGQLLAPRFVSCVGQQEEFLALMQAAWRVEAACRPAKVVWIGDGAKGNWTLASTVCPAAQQILDWFHAVEHATALGRVMLGDNHPLLPTWQVRMEQLLWTGDMDALVQEAMASVQEDASPAELKELANFIGYVRENAHRMNYGAFADAGYLIGSGPVESAHRHVLQERMKKAGQRWSLAGARQMATLRAHYRTAGPKRFYAAAHWARRESQRLNTHTESRKRRASNR